MFLFSFWIAILAIWPGSRKGIPLYAMIIYFLILSFVTDIKVLKWLNMRLTLTNKRLIYTLGVFKKSKREFLLASISNVSVYQSVFQRLVGSGFLVIETGAEPERSHTFCDVPHPEELKECIVAEASRVREGIPKQTVESIAREVSKTLKSEQPTREIAVVPPERPPIYTEIVDQIERLDSMRKSGAITDEEFERAKAALLKKLEESKE